MGLSVLSRAPVTRLLELATVKSRLGITGSSQDPDLTELIDAAHSAFAARVGDPLMRQRYRETRPGTERQRLQVSRWPVDPESVSVEIDGVADTDYTVEDAAHGILWRESGWPVSDTLAGQDPEHSVVITYYAGYVPPASAPARGVVTTWTASTAYVMGAWVRPTSPALSPLLMECTTAGTSGAAQPSWPTAGVTVADGTAVWTARTAEELPPVLRDLAWTLLYGRYQALSSAPGLASWELDGVSESYFASQTAAYLPPAVADGLDQWRANR